MVSGGWKAKVRFLMKAKSIAAIILNPNNSYLKKTTLHGPSPRANYTDLATAACR
jgi:hypothetical protein